MGSNFRVIPRRLHKEKIDGQTERKRETVSGTERGREQNIKREGGERRYLESWLFLFLEKKINLVILIPTKLSLNIHEIFS